MPYSSSRLIAIAIYRGQGFINVLDGSSDVREPERVDKKKEKNTHVPSSSSPFPWLFHLRELAP